MRGTARVCPGGVLSVHRELPRLRRSPSTMWEPLQRRWPVGAAHLVVSRGDLDVHPRCSDRSSAFDKESRSAAMLLLAYGRSTCAELASRVDTKVSHDDTVSGKMSRWVVWLPKPVVTAVVSAHTSRFAEHLPRRCAASRRRSRLARWSRAFGHSGKPAAEAALLRRLDLTSLRVRKSLRCPPSRRVPDKWSGRRPIDT
jgi:hypothetical protein